jgi:hypothetical protein
MTAPTNIPPALDPNAKASIDQVRRVSARAESGSGPTLRITFLILQEPKPWERERRGGDWRGLRR